MLRMIGVYLICYLLGCTPISVIFHKIFGTPDPRKSGSGNIGFSNTMRTSGNKVLSILVLILDISKGLLSCIFAGGITGGCIAIFGNIFSVFPYSSGKGVAALLGCLIYLNYWCVLLMPLWFLIVKKTYPVVGTLLLLIVAFYEVFLLQSILLFCVCVLVLYKHYENILRLFSGKENKM